MKILMMLIILSSAASSYALSEKGLGFTAPSITGKSNVYSPSVGEIIYDESDSTFYGHNHSGSWVSLSSVPTPTVTEMTSFTPTGSWTTNTSYTGFWRRVGDIMEVDVTVSLTGAPNAATALTINLPAGYTFDTAKMSNNVANGFVNGSGVGVYTAGSYPALFQTMYLSTNSIKVISGVVSGTILLQGNVSTTLPVTWGNGDKVHLRFSGPISGWTATN